MMFPFAELGRFDFDARLFSVQSIDDTKYESSEDSEPDAAKRECRGRAASDDETSNRNLVWRDSRFAKKRDDCRFDWSVNVSGQIECSILGGIENDAFSQATVLLLRCEKTIAQRNPTRCKMRSERSRKLTPHNTLSAPGASAITLGTMFSILLRLTMPPRRANYEPLFSLPSRCTS